MDEQNNVYYQNDPRTRPMTFGDWMKILLLLMIPGVNFVLLIIWVFSEDVNISKRNYLRAILVFMGIAYGIC